MKTNKTALSLIDNYRAGKYDDNFDFVFQIAATNGIILLSGDGRQYAHAACDSYSVEDLLLPVDLKTWETITKAYNAGQDIFPKWFSYNQNGYFDFDQQKFCEAFISRKQLTKHKGKFYMDGAPVSRPLVKQAVQKSISIIRQDAGKLLYGTMAMIDTLCVDDVPAAPTERLSKEILESYMTTNGYGIKLNTIKAEYEVVGKSPTGRILNTDDLIILLYDELADSYKGASFEVLTQYTAFIGRENSYNPVLELLGSTKWDGQDRIPQLHKMLGIENDDLSKTLVVKWLLQTVALLFNDEASPFGADGCLVFIGAQSAGKTSLIRHLALNNSWFIEGACIEDRDKDTTRRIVSTWIAELGEVEGSFKGDINKLKAFVSNPFDRYRLPYGKADINAPRHTSIAATCNNEQYLVDTTGNRRWWSIPFKRVIPREELLKLDALQLWAEIYSIVAPMSYQEKSACFRLTQSEKEQLNKRNTEYEQKSKGQMEVEDILAQAQEEKLTFADITITKFQSHWSPLKRYTVQQLGVALRRCGVEPVSKSHNMKLYRLPLPPGEKRPWR